MAWQGWSSYHQFLTTVATKLYSTRSPVNLPNPRDRPITIVCISDTHNKRPDLPAGDLLLHAGDLTQNGSFTELQAQLDWLNSQKHPCKVIIGGNHDLLLDQSFIDRFPERVIEKPGQKRSDLHWGNLIYLQDASCTATFPNGRSLRIYASPWTPQFGNWAFQFPPGRDVFAGKFPNDTDILLTHGPPKYHLDARNHIWCKHLLREIWRIHRGLKLVVFGHIHAGYGTEVLRFDRMQRNYEKILLGDGGLFSFLVVVFCFLWEYVSCMIYAPRIQNTSNAEAVRLVNAAIACGPANEGSRSPLTFQI